MDDPMMAAAVIGFIMGIACSGMVFCIGAVLSFRHLVKSGFEGKAVRDQTEAQLVVKGEVPERS